jgi:hypothetical protein
MTFYYYLKSDRSGYWTLSPPCYVKDQYLASIDADEMPTRTPIEMQADQATALAKMLNPYQG